MDTTIRTGEPPVLFFSVSGLRGAGRTSVYEELRLTLGTKFPEQSFAFVGNPFGRLPLPLLWDKDEREKSPVSKLFECWSMLNDFTERAVHKHLNEGRIVISDGFGLDALLHATACADCSEKNVQAEVMHHSIVKARLVAQGIPAPEYLLVTAPSTRIEEALLAEHKSLRHSTTRRQRVEFIKHQEKMIDRYFDTTDGVQRPPVTLSTHSFLSRVRIEARINKLAKQAARHIGKRIRAS